MKTALAIFAISLILFACTYDVQEEILPEVNPEDTISYTQQVDPILSSNCYSCHNVGNVAGNGIELEPYENLKSYLDSDTEGFLCSIKHESCATAMPIGGAKLSQRDIDIIETWINQGALNN